MLRATFGTSVLNKVFTLTKAKAGAQGVDGKRGSRTFYVQLTGATNTYSDTLATTTASADGGPILNDTVVQYNDSVGFSQTKFWDGDSWAIVNAIVDGNLLVSGTVGASALAANAITADKIRTGTLSADVDITVGSAPGGLPALTLNGAGEVISRGANGDKARFYYGNVEIYKIVPSIGEVVYKALSRSETGVANNNTLVTIPGYFKTQPKVIVSPNSLMLYHTSYANQNQSITCQALNIAETSPGSMVWRFTPVATLNLAANAGSTVVNQASGSQPGAWYSSQYTTPANCSNITPFVALSSNRGNGASQYFYRSVRWRVEYWNGSGWINGAWTTHNLGADTSASVSSNATFTFPFSGTWIYRIYCEAYDTDGSVFGAAAYEYATDTRTHTGTANTADSANSDFGSGTSITTLNMTAYSTPSGWEVYNVAYSYTYGYSVTGSASVSGPGVFQTSGGDFNLTGTYNGSFSTGSWQSFVRLTASQNNSQSRARAIVKTASATISRRRLAANSTTATNNFQFNSYNYTLTSAQVLATGSLNWIALGD